MDKVYIILKVGEETPLAVCTTEDLAVKCVLAEEEEMSKCKNRQLVWYESYHLVSNESEIPYTLGYT